MTLKTTNSTASKIVIPKRYWVYLLLLVGVLWFGSANAIPSPTDIGYTRTFNSPLPRPIIAGILRLAAPLRGWQVQLPAYISEYGFTTKDPLYSGMCTSYPWMIVQIEPSWFIGTHGHIEVREGIICE